jgi:hypothetical protein
MSKSLGGGGYWHHHIREDKRSILFKSRQNNLQKATAMTVTKGRRVIASMAMSAAFFLFGNGPTADAQNSTLFGQDTRGATLKRYHHPERGEVLLRDLGVGVAKATLPELKLDPRLSILVTDVKTTDQIKFSEVMDQLVKQGGDSSLTKDALFRQWWDTAGPAPGLGLGPHCDDESAPKDGFSTRNGFPYRCPRPERSEASSNPFADESADAGYSAIAFSNRFDLIGADVPDPTRPWRLLTPDCGEYRIVFARNSGKRETGGLKRILIIFEARVPNPEPENGVKGCRPILDFWHSLSDKSMSASDRGKKLHDFYLNGLPAYRVGPVVDIAHYTFGTGQIRTNQLLFLLLSQFDFTWTLREFRTVVGSDGKLRIVPDTAKTSPGNDLFRCGSVDPRVASLTLNIRAQIGRLLGLAGQAKGAGDINSIGFSLPGTGENAFEGDQWNQDRAKLGDISAAFLGCDNRTMPNPALSKSIQDALTAAGSPLTPTNIVNRIRTQTCVGCHHYSGGTCGSNELNCYPDDLGGGLAWPPKWANMDFTHVSEREVQNPGSGDRYAISNAAEKFLEFREEFMKRALGLP